MALLTCTEVDVLYDRQIAVQKASFSVEKGEYICIVGSNGSGKSTLIKAILGLLPLSHGTITFDGVYPKETGYLPQQTTIQRDFPASVYEVVLSGFLGQRGLAPFYLSEQKKKALKILEKLRIEKEKNKSYRALSGGQQQRVLLARALCAAGKLLVLDEPAAGLDPIAAEEFYKIIYQLNKEGMTILMVSHDIGSCLLYADKVLCMDMEISFFGTPGDYQKFQSKKQMEAAYHA